MEELLALLGLGGGGLLVGNSYNQLGETGDMAWQESKRIGQDAAELSDFKGYGVTGPVGTSQVDAGGNLNMALNQDQQAQADMYRLLAQGTAGLGHPLARYGSNALGTAESLLGGIGGTGREQEIYDRIRAMQQPEEARQQSTLGTRLAAQGRTGLSTGAGGGGAPEQLALNTSIQEAMNRAAYEAIGLGQNQQQLDTQSSSMLSQAGGGALGQQAGISGQYAGLQYAPQAALMDAFNSGSQAYGYEDIARRQGSGQLAESQMGGLEAKLGANLGQANLTGQLGSGLISGGLGLMTGAIQGGSDTAGEWWDRIKGVFS